MIDHGYRAINDPYCYQGTDILKNKADIKNQERFEEFEYIATGARFKEPLPVGSFDAEHYRAIHYHLFQDIFDWAGQYRTVRISKGDSTFCYPEFIPTEMNRAFASLKREIIEQSLTARDYAQKTAEFLAELNAIHPFREGNGRTQLAFLAALSDAMGHEFSLDMTDPSIFLQAMIDSFKGNTAPLEKAIFANITVI